MKLNTFINVVGNSDILIWKVPVISFSFYSPPSLPLSLPSFLHFFSVDTVYHIKKVYF